MELFKYNQFLGNTINEDLNKSRKFLKEREMLKKAVISLGLLDKDLEYDLKNDERRTLDLSYFTDEQQQQIKQKLREIKISDQELKNLEKDEGFVKLRELLKDNLGYLYNFTYMYYVEMVPISEIEDMYKKLIEYKQILDKLAEIPEVGKKFDVNFINPNIPNTEEHRTNSEILAEGLEKLESHKKVKKIIDTLTPKLKKAYKDTSELLKDEMVQVAIAFDSLSDDKADGEKISVKERVWKNFFGEMRMDTDEFLPDGKKNPNFGKKVYKSRLKRFEDSENPIRDFINAAKAHLEASQKSGYSEKVEKISDCNDKFGINGCEVVFDKNGIIIVKINSYAANKFMNSHTNHCIVSYESYWNQYQGEYNVQYYIYNINVSNLNEYNTIGVTIKPDRSWSSGACQTARNTNISNFKKLLRDWEKEYNIDEGLFDKLEPLSNEEVERRKKAKEAERKIIEKGISIDQIKEYVTVYGANINKDNCKALINAVEEDDYEKTKYILSLGGDPNLQKDELSALSKAKNLDMIKLLVTFGANMNGSVFKNIVSDVNAVEFCLKAGMDPNFANSKPFRDVIKGSYVNRSNIGESYLDVFKILLKYGAKIYNAAGRNMFLKWGLDYARFEMFDYLEEKGITFPKKEWLDAKSIWINHNRSIPEEKLEEVKQYVDKKIEESN
jgi:hypothetical protein